jgi:hypothetical protein
MKAQYYLLILVIVLISCKKDRNFIDEINSNPAFAIGIITKFQNASPRLPTDTFHHSSYVWYKFTVNGVEYKHSYPTGYPGNMPDSGPKSDEKFIVDYIKDYPKYSFMLFDYPVKDSSDYNKYIEEFKTNPLHLDY